MQFDSTESTVARRSSDRSARVLAAIALVAAGLAILPIAFHGERTAAAAPAATSGTTDGARPKPTEHGGTPSYFGFLEFDWEHGVPGFDPRLVEGSRP